MQAAYQGMQTIERQLGGGEGIVGMYGSLRPAGMHSILEEMHLNQRSVLLDMGAGLGRPLVHAVVEFGVAGAIGWELDPIKCEKSKAMMTRLVESGILSAAKKPIMLLKDAATGRKLPDGTTHVFAFWEGFRYEDREAVGKLWRACPTAEYIAVVQHAIAGVHPEEEMNDLRFGSVTMLAKLPVSQSGGGSRYTAYIFKKNRGRNRDPRLAAQRRLVM